MRDSTLRLILANSLLGTLFFLWSPAGLRAEMDNNVKFEMVRGSATYEKPRVEFRPGDWVQAYTKKFNHQGLSGLAGKEVTFLYEFESGGKNLATHSFRRKYAHKGAYFKLNILPDPDSNIDIVFRWDWSGNFARALAGLAPGRYEITLRGFVEADGQKTMIVRGDMVFDNRGGNGKLSEIAARIDKKRGFDSQKENAKFQPKHVDFPVNVTLYNGCLDRIVVRYRTRGNHESSVTLNGRQSKKVVALALESLLVHRRGKVQSGPTVSRRSEGKTLRVCR